MSRPIPESAPSSPPRPPPSNQAARPPSAGGVVNFAGSSAASQARSCATRAGSCFRVGGASFWRTFEVCGTMIHPRMHRTQISFPARESANPRGEASQAPRACKMLVQLASVERKSKAQRPDGLASGKLKDDRKREGSERDSALVAPWAGQMTAEVGAGEKYPCCYLLRLPPASSARAASAIAMAITRSS